MEEGLSSGQLIVVYICCSFIGIVLTGVFLRVVFKVKKREELHIETNKLLREIVAKGKSKIDNNVDGITDVNEIAKKLGLDKNQ
jgi:hypothetical protein